MPSSSHFQEKEQIINLINIIKLYKINYFGIQFINLDIAWLSSSSSSLVRKEENGNKI
jgi:hypothetical protein